MTQVTQTDPQAGTSSEISENYRKISPDFFTHAVSEPGSFSFMELVRVIMKKLISAGESPNSAP